MLDRAYHFAKKCHKDIMRQDGSEYIDHPLAVVEILKLYSMPEEVLVAGMLHDVCEDTEVTEDIISKEFTPRIAFMLNILSKNKKIQDIKKIKKDFLEKKEKGEICQTDLEEYTQQRLIIYINRIYTGIIADPHIFFIKAADQIHNLSTIETLPEKKRIRKKQEILEYFGPIYEKIESIIPQQHKEAYDDIIQHLKELSQ
jgi:GTP diphosphokinase / guanosine-3',5'-bis(diphosphate) 3'-diphosphatase